MSLIDDYNETLDELKFNSLPIIDTLTTIAKENPDQAPGIAAAVLARIHRALPEHKLFSMYVLDNICKLVGAPYPGLFGREIFQLFTHVFLVGDDKTRGALLKLYNSWKGQLPSLLLLFTPAEMERLHAFLDKAGYLISDEQRRLVEQTRRLIDAYELRRGQREMSRDRVKEAGDKIAVLRQLQGLLAKLALKPAETQAVEKKLAELESGLVRMEPAPAKSALKQAPRLPARGPTSGTSVTLLFRMVVAAGIVEVNQPPVPGAVAHYKIHHPKIKYQRQLMALLLLDNLLQFSQVPRLDYDKVKYSQMRDVAAAVDAEGPQAFLKSDELRLLTTLGLLYGDKPLQCNQCGKRFETDDDGERRKQLHLDWHFRINSKQAQQLNVQLRDWFIDDYEWVEFRDEVLLEYATDKPAAADAAPMEVDELPPGPGYVVVPEDSTNMENRCIICREVIKAKYLDDTGEWIWPDAIRLPNDPHDSRRIMHITCYRESRKRGADDAGHHPSKRSKA